MRTEDRAPLPHTGRVRVSFPGIERLGHRWVARKRNLARDNDRKSANGGVYIRRTEDHLICVCPVRACRNVG